MNVVLKVALIFGAGIALSAPVILACYWWACWIVMTEEYDNWRDEE